MATKAKKRPREEGEITCTAESNGRKITLDPLSEHDVTFKLAKVESTIPCGLRTGWASGEKDGKKFDLLCGAGCGSPYLIVHYGDDQYCVHARVLMDAIFAAIDPEQ